MIVTPCVAIDDYVIGTRLHLPLCACCEETKQWGVTQLIACQSGFHFTKAIATDCAPAAIKEYLSATRTIGPTTVKYEPQWTISLTW